jgi:hypothetical protein
MAVITHSIFYFDGGTPSSTGVTQTNHVFISNQTKKEHQQNGY